MSEGNHDILLDPAHPSNAKQIRDEELEVKEGAGQDEEKKQALGEKQWERLAKLAADPSSRLTWLSHEARKIRLTNPTGPQTAFKIFGSPYSPSLDGWAFGYTPDQAPTFWDDIPLDTDILVTHVPPKGHLDISNGKSRGCEHLQHRLGYIRPRLVICGHVHEGRGYHRIQWGGGDAQYPCEIRNTIVGDLPNGGGGGGQKHSKKQSTIDLCRKPGNRLDNDGVMRNETCVVNAAIMANSWPHKGGKRFNAPIVVDLDLPEVLKGGEL